MPTGAFPVVLQIATLATHPMCAHVRQGASTITYDTRAKFYEISATKGLLPRSCDVPVLWYLLARLQSERIDYPEARTITIAIDDIVVGTKRALQTNNRKSVITAIRRYDAMRVRIHYKLRLVAQHTPLKQAPLLKARFIADGKVKITFANHYLKAIDEQHKTQKRYVSLDHMVSLSGFASQLYGILLGPLSRKCNTYKINARTLARKLFGDERGGNAKDMPCARFFDPYLLDALSEIHDKTCWAIDCQKHGRGKHTTLTFSTISLPDHHKEYPSESAPNAWAISRAHRPKKQRDQPAVKSTPPKKNKRTQASETNPDLPDSIQKHIDASSKTIGTGVAKILKPVIAVHGENGGLAVVMYALSQPIKTSLAAYLRGMGDGMFDYAKKHGPKVQQRIDMMNRRIEHRFKTIAKAFIENGEDRNRLEMSCTRSKIPLAEFNDWLDANQGWFTEEKAKRKSRLKEKELKRIASLALHFSQGGGFWNAVDIGRSKGIDAAMLYCDKNTVGKDRVREYLERLAQE